MAQKSVREMTPRSFILGENGREITFEDWIGISKPKGMPPVIKIDAKTLPEAWERAVLATWFYGGRIPTQYDLEEDPASRDSIMMMVISDPLAEPRIHLAMPGGIKDLGIYVLEFTEGVHDHWVDTTPGSTKWTHTYHERLTAYEACRFEPGHPGIHYEWEPESYEPCTINQLDLVIEELVKAPHTRRAQAIIWQPWMDPGTEHPPCMQRLWFRVFGDQLVMNVNIRSNDAFKAAFMNMYAFTELQKGMAAKLSERLGREIRVGQCTYIADSFHLYGSYFTEFADFLETLKKRPWEERIIRSDAQLVQEIFGEARAKIAQEQQQGSS